MVVIQILLTLLFTIGFVYTLRKPILYKPRQDAGDIIRFVFYNGIELILLIGVIICLWYFL